MAIDVLEGEVMAEIVASCGPAHIKGALCKESRRERYFGTAVGILVVLSSAFPPDILHTMANATATYSCVPYSRYWPKPLMQAGVSCATSPR